MTVNLIATLDVFIILEHFKSGSLLPAASSVGSTVDSNQGDKRWCHTLSHCLHTNVRGGMIVEQQLLREVGESLVHFFFLTLMSMISMI